MYYHVYLYIFIIIYRNPLDRPGPSSAPDHVAQPPADPPLPAPIAVAEERPSAALRHGRRGRRIPRWGHQNQNSDRVRNEAGIKALVEQGVPFYFIESATTYYDLEDLRTMAEDDAGVWALYRQGVHLENIVHVPR
jgi:hypothetical protein